MSQAQHGASAPQRPASRDRSDYESILSRSLLLVALLFLSFRPSLAAEARHLARDDYDGLQQWLFSSKPVAVPEGGLRWDLDTATWHLESGLLWPQQPTNDGRITGVVFEGRGRFELSVPDPVELRQLRRFAEHPELQKISETFDALLARWVGALPLESLLPTGARDYVLHPLARGRHEHWLTLRHVDADARVLAALLRSEDSYARVDMRTANRGWLTYDYDAQRPEEIALEWFNPRYKILESWLRLDRAEDRDERGRPSGAVRAVVDIDHVEITADLTELANESVQGVAKVRPVKAKIRATLRFDLLHGADRALQLFLHPWAKVTEVVDEDRKPLPFVRDHLGRRSRAIEKKVYDDSLIVLFSQPLARGSTRGITVAYELELPGYAPGRSWYPSASYPGGGLRDRHTARLTLVCRDNYAVRSMGRLEEERAEGNLRTSVWTLDEPVKMATFVFAKKHHEETFAFDGLPEVATFSSLGGYLSEGRVRQVGADVVNSLDFFQDLFGTAAGGERLQAAIIPASHGQAFDGLLHIGDFSTLTDRVAEQELFRSHEVAHLWWGHKVGWRSYRDQWLSEGFAQYSAMLFVEARVDKGGKYFEEMLKSLSDELTGSLESSFSQFNRPGVPLLNKLAADRIGPIGHGRRCVVGEAPSAFFSQTYNKGALVLHMLRTTLLLMSGSDEAFFDTLRTFASRFEGRYASTADFEAVLEEVVPADWSWFFDQWIDRAEIPTYIWSHEVARSADGYTLDLWIEQEDVGPDFKMAVPVRVELEGEREETFMAFIDEPSKYLSYSLDAAPRKVVFNPDRAVLARVKRRAK